MALPANTLIGTGGATTAGASEAGLAAVISVPLAAVIAFFAVLLYPSSVVSGEEEQQMLEQARQQAQSRLQVTLRAGCTKS